ncbi:hypothetical protein HY493_05700 [Candidatus Woesearchaeota archaeon]|nr:hypothetical protein [Candidatus Woesearchaeota archaeon]
MTLVISTCAEELSEPEFVTPLARIARCHVKHYRSVSPKDIAKADRIIISGTALKDFAYLDSDWSWLKDVKIPVLGICAGWQVLLQAVPTYPVGLVDDVVIGPREVEVIASNPLATGRFSAYFLHTKNGAGVFDVLAVVNTLEGPVPCMFKHPSRELYGCSFHPEVMNEEIIQNFLDLDTEAL